MAKKTQEHTDQKANTSAEWLRYRQSAISTLRTKAHLSWPERALLALSWSVLGFTELALHLFIHRRTLYSHDLALGGRLLLLCYSLSVLTIFLIFTATAIKLVVASGRHVFPDSLVASWIGRVSITLLVWLVLVFYGASWGLYWQTGSFIGSEVFIFMAPHPLQVFHWVDLDVALIILGLAGTAAIAITAWLPRLAAHQKRASQQMLFSLWLWIIGVSLAGAFLGNLYGSWGERRFTRAGILYSRNRDNNSGPLSYLVTDLTKRFTKTTERFSRDRSLQIAQRSIVSMHEYTNWIGPSRPKRWNVLILTVESLRADQLRVYGGKREIMPTIENLASDGRVFLNTYTQSSHTNYATITPLSSHYPLRSATAYTYPKNPTYPRVLIYDVLKAMGYHTAIFSSSNENWGGMINYLDTGNLDRFVHAANSKRPTYLTQGDAAFAIWARETKHAGSLDDRATVDETIEWIDGLENEPFFIAMNFQNSHLPYPVPPDFPRRFGPAKLDFTIRFAHFPRDKSQVVKDVYADSLAYVDFQVGRLFQYLKKKNKWQNTLVVVTGDHGQAFYEHGFASHASAIYDEVMKVPLVIRAPGLEPGVDTRLTQHVDVAPSVLGLLGLPIHPSFQGIDLFHTSPNPNRSVYMVAQTPDAYQYGIVRAGFKLIYDERQQEYLLFNLASDPGEKTDLATALPVVAKELANRLNAWRKLQIDYYADPVLQVQEYPPILKD